MSTNAVRDDLYAFIKAFATPRMGAADPTTNPPPPQPPPGPPPGTPPKPDAVRQLDPKKLKPIEARMGGPKFGDMPDVQSVLPKALKDLLSLNPSDPGQIAVPPVPAPEEALPGPVPPVGGGGEPDRPPPPMTEPEVQVPDINELLGLGGMGPPVGPGGDVGVESLPPPNPEVLPDVPDVSPVTVDDLGFDRNAKIDDRLYRSRTDPGPVDESIPDINELLGLNLPVPPVGGGGDEGVERLPPLPGPDRPPLGPGGDVGVDRLPPPQFEEPTGPFAVDPDRHLTEFLRPDLSAMQRRDLKPTTPEEAKSPGPEEAKSPGLPKALKPVPISPEEEIVAGAEVKQPPKERGLPPPPAASSPLKPGETKALPEKFDPNVKIDRYDPSSGSFDPIAVLEKYAEADKKRAMFQMFADLGTLGLAAATKNPAVAGMVGGGGGGGEANVGRLSFEQLNKLRDQTMGTARAKWRSTANPQVEKILGLPSGGGDFISDDDVGKAIAGRAAGGDYEKLPATASGEISWIDKRTGHVIHVRGADPGAQQTLQINRSQEERALRGEQRTEAEITGRENSEEALIKANPDIDPAIIRAYTKQGGAGYDKIAIKSPRFEKRADGTTVVYDDLNPSKAPVVVGKDEVAGRQGEAAAKKAELDIKGTESAQASAAEKLRIRNFNLQHADELDTKYGLNPGTAAQLLTNDGWDDFIKNSSVYSDAKKKWMEQKAANPNYKQTLDEFILQSGQLASPTGGGGKGTEFATEALSKSRAKIMADQGSVDTRSRILRLSRNPDVGPYLGSRTGEAKLALAREVGPLLGIDVEGVADATTLDALFEKGATEILASGALGAGTGISDADKKAARTSIGGGQWMTPQAIQAFTHIQAVSSVAAARRHNADIDFQIENETLPGAKRQLATQRVPLPKQDDVATLLEVRPDNLNALRESQSDPKRAQRAKDEFDSIYGDGMSKFFLTGK